VGTAPACFSPSYQSGRLLCDEGRCPPGYFCAPDRRCWINGSGPPPADGGPPGDVALDAPADGAASEVGPGGDASDAPPVVGEALLASLEVTPGALRPPFSPLASTYSVDLPLFSGPVTLRAQAAQATAGLSLNGMALASSFVSVMFSPTPGTSVTSIQVSTPATSNLYSIFFSVGGLTTYVKAMNTRPQSQYGAALALGGNTLVVGAPGESGGLPGINPDPNHDSGQPVGAVYVLVKTPAGWQQQAFLKPHNPHPGMAFGTAVAIAGDTLVVGAPMENGSSRTVDGPVNQDAAEAGAAYVFVRTAGVWRQQAYLKASDADVGDRLGTAVAVSASGIIAGAPGADGPRDAVDAGAAYVFVPAGNSFAQQGLLLAPIPQGGDELGAAVAIEGELAAVGAPKEDRGGVGVNSGSGSTAADSGAVFVYRRNGGIWMLLADLKPTNTAPMFHFGSAVALSGGFLAVGAPDESGAGSGVDRLGIPGTAPASGAVYLFQQAGATFVFRHSFKASSSAAQDRFGSALFLSPERLVVGAPGENSSGVGVNVPRDDSAAPNSGAAYVFRPSGAAWAQMAAIKAPNTEGGDAFGSAVAVDGDTVASGAPGEASAARGLNGNSADNGMPRSGAVFVY